MSAKKFRSWNKKSKVMSIEYTLEDALRHEVDFLEECIYLQFTGLFDKEGVDIYDGDIIGCICVNGLNEESLYTGVVEWCIEDGGFFLKVKKIEDKKGRHAKNYYTTLKHHANKVIGNIYENPELLEEYNDNHIEQ